MPIPDFNRHGLLPVGVYDCTLAEVRDRFGSFKVTERRPNLFRKLELLLTQVRAAQLSCSVIIDGSFVTIEPQPNDIDLVLVLSQTHNMSTDLTPAQYLLISKRSV